MGAVRCSEIPLIPKCRTKYHLFIFLVKGLVAGGINTICELINSNLKTGKNCNNQKHIVVNAFNLEVQATNLKADLFSLKSVVFE